MPKNLNIEKIMSEYESLITKNQNNGMFPDIVKAFQLGKKIEALKIETIISKLNEEIDDCLAE